MVQYVLRHPFSKSPALNTFCYPFCKDVVEKTFRFY